MSRYDFPGQAAAAYAYDHACDCCDHEPKTGEPADLHDDGSWSPCGKHQPLITLSVDEMNRQYRELLASGAFA